ncbi:MAG: hypothetical protein QW735_00820 [archaeon]
MRRGFSLFSALIGTLLVLIASFTAVVVVENNVRVSKSLINFQENSFQSNSAKMIKATVESHIYAQIENAIASNFTLDLSKYGSSENLKYMIIRKLENDLTLGGNGIYQGMGSSVESATEYSPEYPANFYDQLSKTLGEIKPITLSCDSEGKVKIEIDGSKFKGKDIFKVTFKNKNNEKDKLTIFIGPESRTWVSSAPLCKRLEKSYIAAKNDGSCGQMKAEAEASRVEIVGISQGIEGLTKIIFRYSNPDQTIEYITTTISITPSSC